VEIIDDPTHTFVIGSHAAYGQVDAIDAARAKKVQGGKAEGHRLMERVKGHEELYGRVLSKEEAHRLGRHQVLATPNPVLFEPTWKGVEHIWRTKEDWLSRLAYQGLDTTIRQGAAQGWRSNLHGTNPLPAIFFGSEMKVKPGPRGEY
jgi:hypothetical protein